MKTIRRIFLVIVFFIFFLISCYEFLSIEQPDLADPNSIFEVPITVSLTPEEEGGRGYFGILLPIGWTVEDSISYSGVHNGAFIYSSEQSDSMEAFDNAPEGYYWWVSVSDTVESLLEGTVSFTPLIHTDNQTGTFFIVYMITDRFDGLYVSRSTKHPISVGAPMTATVTNTNDSGAGSLRQAISNVSSSGEILFDLAYPATITLDSQLVVDRNVTVIGPETGELTISGNNKNRVIDINKHLNVNISNLTITDGRGGGIRCDNSDLNLENVLITGNLVTANDGGGLYCLESDVSLKNVKIVGNIANGGRPFAELNEHGNGGGIYCRSSNLSFSNVTIANNSAKNVGGGILFLYNSTILFDSESRSNIYSNKAFLGNDLYSDNISTINVVLDTFTVLYPTSYHAYPPNNFNFDILNAKITQYDADLYVSSDGDDSDNGTSPSEALKTISFAFAKIMADSLNPHSIYIDNGIYSPSVNGEDFPLSIPDYVTLSGASRDNVILDAENETCVIQIFLRSFGGRPPPERFKQINMVENMTITGGNAGGIQCWESILSLNNVTITDNFWLGGGSYGGGITCDHSILNLTNVTLSNNHTEGAGGGINSSGDSEVNLSNVTISSNSAGDGSSGGGIKGGDLSLTNVRIIGNSAGSGGGIGWAGKMNLAGVTIANNHATIGGGIYFLWDTKVFFDTENRCNIYSNQAEWDNVDHEAGDDLYADNPDSIITVIVDTFTVLNPTEVHAYPINNFTFNILHAAVTDISEETNILPNKFTLNQNYPNPFNPSTKIKFALPKPDEVKIELYNTLGQRVETLLNKAMKAGYHEIEFNAQDLSSGIYFYRIEAGEFQDVKKMILIR